MKFKEVIFKLLESHSGVSSKRACGFIGWIACLGAMIYCTINRLQAPLVVDSIIYACLGLLGIDSITGIWKDKNRK